MCTSAVFIQSAPQARINVFFKCKTPMSTYRYIYYTIRYQLSLIIKPCHRALLAWRVIIIYNIMQTAINCGPANNNILLYRIYVHKNTYTHIHIIIITFSMILLSTHPQVTIIIVQLLLLQCVRILYYYIYANTIVHNIRSMLVCVYVQTTEEEVLACIIMHVGIYYTPLHLPLGTMQLV